MIETNSTYKLNRIFNILFNPENNIQIVVTVILLVFWSIFWNKFDIPLKVIGALIFVTIMALDMFFHSPKYLVMKDQKICFDEYVQMKPNVFIRGIFYWVKVSYSVSNVHNVKFNQSFIEKIFDIGHISFEGEATFIAKKDMDRIKKVNKFKIYGIRNFSRFKSEILL